MRWMNSIGFSAVAFFKTPDEVPFAHVHLPGDLLHGNIRLESLFDIPLRIVYLGIVMLALPGENGKNAL